MRARPPRRWTEPRQRRLSSFHRDRSGHRRLGLWDCGWRPRLLGCRRLLCKVKPPAESCLNNPDHPQCRGAAEPGSIDYWSNTFRRRFVFWFSARARWASSVNLTDFVSPTFRTSAFDWIQSDESFCLLASLKTFWQSLKHVSAKILQVFSTFLPLVYGLLLCFC